MKFVPLLSKKIEKRIDSSSLEVIEENSEKLKNLEVGKVIIKTKRPIIVKLFNDLEELWRFILVKEENLCAGGVITSNKIEGVG